MLIKKEITIEKRKDYKCPKCDNKYSNWEVFNQHVSTHGYSNHVTLYNHYDQLISLFLIESEDQFDLFRRRIPIYTAVGWKERGYYNTFGNKVSSDLLEKIKKKKQELEQIREQIKELVRFNQENMNDPVLIEDY